MVKKGRPLHAPRDWKPPASPSPVVMIGADIYRLIDLAGLVIVPKEPTDTMIAAACDDFDKRHRKQSYSDIYRAMVVARPHRGGR